jgi:hypothetical protein
MSLFHGSPPFLKEGDDEGGHEVSRQEAEDQGCEAVKQYLLFWFFCNQGCQSCNNGQQEGDGGGYDKIHIFPRLCRYGTGWCNFQITSYS